MTAQYVESIASHAVPVVAVPAQVADPDPATLALKAIVK